MKEGCNLNFHPTRREIASPYQARSDICAVENKKKNLSATIFIHST